ncbi:MAG: hypothetical protein ACYC67_21875 [Prosthecobacter sp.]|jgi:hypothetical protein
MRRPTGFELGLVLLGAFLLITGTAMIIHPTEVDVARPGSPRTSSPATFEHVSKTGVVVAGGFSALSGIAILWGVFARRDR